MYDVQVFPGGTEVGLEIQRAPCECKDVRLHSAGLGASNHAPHVFAWHFVIPSVYEPGWIASLSKIIIEQGVDHVFPAYDDVLIALAQNAERIKARIVSSPLETCLITRSKLQTYQLFSGVLPIPTLYNSPEAVDQYPVFVKPDRGQGSQDTHVIDNRNHHSQL